MVPMALQLLAAPSDPALLDLPWGTPLEDWPPDQLVALPRGLSRHVVRFVRLGEAVYAVKEIAENAALREYGLLRQLERREMPAVEAVAVVSGRVDDRAIRWTRPSSPGTCSSRCPTARCSPRRCAATRPTGCSTPSPRCSCGCTPPGSTGATARSPTRCSGATPVRSRRTSSMPRPASCTARCRTVSVGTTSSWPAPTSPVSCSTWKPAASCTPRSTRSRPRTWWPRATATCGRSCSGSETFDTGERYRIDQRIRRLNELGFDVAELNIVTDIDGRTVQLEPKVVDAGHHSRRLLRLTGLDVEENQARRLLNDLDAYRAAKDVQGESEEIVAHRWVDDSFEPVVRAVPKDLRGKLEPAEIFHEVLEHRWFLSEREGRDVGLLPAARSYVADVLTHKPDERAVLGSRIGSPTVEADPYVEDDEDVED